MKFFIFLIGRKIICKTKKTQICGFLFKRYIETIKEENKDIDLTENLVNLSSLDRKELDRL